MPPKHKSHHQQEDIDEGRQQQTQGNEEVIDFKAGGSEFLNSDDPYDKCTDKGCNFTKNMWCQVCSEIACTNNAKHSGHHMMQLDKSMYETMKQLPNVEKLFKNQETALGSLLTTLTNFNTSSQEKRNSREHECRNVLRFINDLTTELLKKDKILPILSPQAKSIEDQIITDQKQAQKDLKDLETNKITLEKVKNLLDMNLTVKCQDILDDYNKVNQEAQKFRNEKTKKIIDQKTQTDASTTSNLKEAYEKAGTDAMSLVTTYIQGVVARSSSDKDDKLLPKSIPQVEIQ